MNRWQAVVLAASRGPDDPMAKAYGVLHKCRIPIGGEAMIARVVSALQKSGCVEDVSVVTETPDAYAGCLEGRTVRHIPAQRSAPASALAAIATYPTLITTGDHALLTPEMVRFVCGTSTGLGADFTAGLARAEVIQAAYPQTKRTYFRFGSERVSGCNLFTVHSPRGLKVLERWQDLERHRKQPWKLVGAFGIGPLVKFALGRLTLEGAFAEASTRIGATVKPMFLPFAEAAIDVDKPSDKDLAEEIVRKRTR
jgi:GTP:adenosylcobinamide-phosphate guanylyltransferase